MNSTEIPAVTSKLSPNALAGLAEGRARPALAPVREYHVESATRPGVIHRVFVGAHTALCTCESKGRCWHLDAVVARELATPAELAVMDEAIEHRRAVQRAEGEAAFEALR